MMISEKIQNKEEWSFILPDMCKDKLLGYADSFRELAGCFAGEFTGKNTDRRQLMEEHLLWENRQVILCNLNEVAKIMTQMAGEVFRLRPMEAKRSRYLVRNLRDERISAYEPCYIPDCGNHEQLGIVLATKVKGGIPGDFVAGYLSVLLRKNYKLANNSPALVDGTRRCFTFVEEPDYVFLTGYARVVKEKEEISGDNYSIFESIKGHLFVLISDGTGSGEKANTDSARVLDLMEKLLETGYDTASALALVNAAMFTRQDQLGFPTIDIAALNLYTGTCEFFKSGAAASFIKHGKKIFRVEGGSLPMGILKKAEFLTAQHTLFHKDYVILMTDGILEAFDGSGEHAIEECLSEIEEQNPKEIAEKILQKAICLNGGHIRDDMTIVVVGLWENAMNT